MVIWVGYETWPPFGRCHSFVIDWSKYSSRNTSVAKHSGITWPMGSSTVFQSPLTVSLHKPNGRQMPAVRVVQGDCEIIYIHSGKLHSSRPSGGGWRVMVGGDPIRYCCPETGRLTSDSLSGIVGRSGRNSLRVGSVLNKFSPYHYFYIFKTNKIQVIHWIASLYLTGVLYLRLL